MNNNVSSVYSEKIRKHRRLKFGAFAVTLTVVVVALVVIANIVFSALAGKFGWYADMTEEKIYGITDATYDLLNGYRGTNEFKIHIVFCDAADKLKESYYSMLVYNLAKRYAEEFDFIAEPEHVDIINHPEAVNKYLATTVSKPKTTSVYLVKEDLTKPDEELMQSRIYTINSFYTFDSDTGNVFAFNGEYKLTAGILQLVGDSPIAYFITGHGETTDGSVMWTLFEDAGFEVKNIDLSKENFDDAAKVAVINCPTGDYMGDGATVNEIKKIDGFLDKFGGLMVFMDVSTPALPELDALLEEWGIRFEQKQVRDYSNSLSVNGTELVAEYVTEGTGASLTKDIRGLKNPPKAVLNNAKPISFTYTPGTDGTYAKTVGSSVRTVSPILTSSSEKTAEALSLTDNTAEAEKGKFNLVTVSVDQQYIENEPQYSYVLAAGTSSFADDKYIGSSAYANRDIIFNVMKSFSKKTVPLDMDFKVFEDEGLTLTTAESNRCTVLLTVLPALAVTVVGIVIYTRRRYL